MTCIVTVFHVTVTYFSTVNWKLRLTNRVKVAAATTQADGVQLYVGENFLVLTSVDFRLRKEEEGT